MTLLITGQILPVKNMDRNTHLGWIINNDFGNIYCFKNHQFQNNKKRFNN